MPILYVDNFRGFQKTFLPLKNVNFFVGENSTGKTSILKLIRLLSSQQFWFDLQFDAEETDLGFYTEIVSKNADDPSYFEVGIVGDSSDKYNRISAILIRFASHKGVPKISQLRMIDMNTDVLVNIKDDKFEYSFSKIDLSSVSENNKLQYFKIWIDRNEKGHTEFDSSKIPGEGFPLIFFIKAQLIQKLRELSPNEASDQITSSSFNLPNFLEELTWLAPIRAEPQRTYDKHKLSFNPEGSHAPYILKELLSKSGNEPKRINRILNKFGIDSGLFKKIEISSLRNDSTAPFELHIYLDKKPIKISNVGYGVSQVLPLIIEIIKSKNPTWYAIQQPEIHLHPRSQAAFGELVFKSYLNEKKKFIIETHSDFTIDRFRLKVRQEFKSKRKEREIFQIVFFERIEGRNKLSTININNNGTYSDSQPETFKSFFIKEQLDLLEL